MLSVFFATKVDAATFSVTEDLEMTAVARFVNKNAKCGNGVCLNVHPNCPVGAVFTRPIANGVSGLDVSSLQEFLSRGGYMVMSSSTVLGTFGPVTATGLAKFQKANNLNQSGVVDNVTRAFLNKMFFEKGTCFVHYRPDLLDVKLAKTAPVQAVAADLNSKGYTSAFGQLFCSTSRSRCLNLTRTKTFTMYVPPSVGVMKTVTAFKNVPKIISDIYLVQTKLGDVAFKKPVYVPKDVEVATTTSSTAVIPTTIQTYVYSFTPSNMSVSQNMDEYRAILESGIPLSDSGIFGSWQLKKFRGVTQSTISGEDVQVSFDEISKALTVSGCGKVTGKLVGAHNVIKLNVTNSELRLCTNAARVLAEGEIVLSLKDGVKYEVVDQDILVLRTAADILFEFTRK